MSDIPRIARPARRTPTSSPTSPTSTRAEPRAHDAAAADALVAQVDEARTSPSSLRARSRARRTERPAGRPLPLPRGPNEFGVYVRSFHFSESFGGGFHGDNRGFSTDADATARIHAGAVVSRGDDGFEVAGRVGGHSDPSAHPAFRSGQGIPIIAGGLRKIDERTSEVILTYTGNMPLTVSPAIDADARFLMSDVSPTMLHIHAEVRGDAFPNAECILRDSTGGAVFLGVHSLHIRQTPMTSLPGDGDLPMIEVDLMVERNAETGAFTGVVYNGQRFGIADWNGRFENADPQAGDALFEDVEPESPLAAEHR